MEKTLEIINKLQKERIIRKYAIGGGIASIVYIEPIITYDLDIFFVPIKEEKSILNLSPIYEWLKNKGYKPDKEHIIIEGIPVQFIPVYNELIIDAVENAIEINYQNAKIKVVKPGYLIAIMLQTFRPKDKERIIKLIDEAEIDSSFLQKILQKHRLKEKFDKFIRVYYGE